MKIAVAIDQNKVSEHFGYCEGFNIFEVENNAIAGQEFVQNPGHRKGFLPEFLHEKGASVIIAGGMGANAISLFNDNGIEVITGASGDPKDMAEQYLQGNLKTSGSVCHQHKHHDTCSDE